MSFFPQEKKNHLENKVICFRGNNDNFPEENQIFYPGEKKCFVCFFHFCREKITFILFS